MWTRSATRAKLSRSSSAARGAGRVRRGAGAAARPRRGVERPRRRLLGAQAVRRGLGRLRQGAGAAARSREAWLGRATCWPNAAVMTMGCCLDKALALRPGVAEAWFGRGNIYIELRRYGEALPLTTPRSQPSLNWSKPGTAAATYSPQCGKSTGLRRLRQSAGPAARLCRSMARSS